ncbi:MAG TPA: hypothetical protein VNZ64_13280 [Candidatus Acidoferrum sp.]|nr:hypothetical protein [Candidatus Acidoferrum sp.]
MAPRAGGAVKELVFKGPPRPRQPPRAARSKLLSAGVILGGAVAVLSAVLYLQRRRKSPNSPKPKSDKEELVMPKEFLLKEPAPYKEPMTFD